MGDPARPPHIVVHPPALDGSRRVTSGDAVLGLAAEAEDLALAGLQRAADAGDEEGDEARAQDERHPHAVEVRGERSVARVRRAARAGR